MSMGSTSEPLTIFDIFSAIWRYKIRVVMITTFLTIGTTALVLLVPRKYESEAKLFVRLGGSTTSVDPTSLGPTIGIQDSRETEMNSILDMLQSRGLAEVVVERIGEDRLLEKFDWVEVQMERLLDKLPEFGAETVNSNAEALAVNSISKKRESAIDELSSNLKISSPKKATSISIIFRSRNPVLSKDVVDAVVETYQEMHVAANKSSGAIQFFGEQFEQQKIILNASEEELRQVKNQAKMLTMQGKKDSLQSEYNTVRQLIIQAESDLAGAKRRFTELQSELSQLPETIESEKTTGIEQGASDNMRDRLFALEIQEKELASKFLEDHPELRKVRKQLEEARKIMDEQPLERQHLVVAANPVAIEMRKELVLSQANLESLETRLTHLRQMEDDLVTQIESANALELRASDLERKIHIAQENFNDYARKYEESRIKAARDGETISNLSVVSAPSIRLKPVSPKRSLLALVGAMFSCVTGVFFALLADFQRRRKLELSHAIVRRQEAVPASAQSTHAARTVTPAAREENTEDVADSGRTVLPR